MIVPAADVRVEGVVFEQRRAARRCDGGLPDHVQAFVIEAWSAE